MVRLRLARRLADERGVGVVTALALTLVVFSAGVAWTTIGTHQAESSSHERNREQALHAAEAGINFAVSRLAADILWSGTTVPASMADSTGQYEVTVTPVDPSDPMDLDRYIVAKGYSPAKDAMRPATRQLEQQVLLDPMPAFAYALFASPGGIVSQNSATISGDIYSADDLNFGQFANLSGTIVTRGDVTIGNQSVVTAYLHALGNATIDNTQTTFQGTVYTGGNISLTATLYGDVQAGGSVTLGSSGSVSGTIKQNSPPPDPPLISQPTYTWNAANYDHAFEWSGSPGFLTYWSSNLDNMYGGHKVNNGDDNSNKITLDKKWALTGDVTLVSNAPVTLARDIVNASGGDVTLTIISFSDREPAIQMTNMVTINDPSVKLLLFAPNGTVDFSQLKDFRGAVYGENIKLSQNFTLERSVFDLPGFNFDATSAPQFRVLVRTFREVPFAG